VSLDRVDSLHKLIGCTIQVISIVSYNYAVLTSTSQKTQKQQQ